MQRTEAGVRLTLRLTPKAGADAIGEIVEIGGAAVLTARVRAVPDKGAANAALVKLIAEWAGVPQANVTLASGGKSRLKTVAIAGEPDALAARLAPRLAAAGWP